MIVIWKEVSEMRVRKILRSNLMSYAKIKSTVHFLSNTVGLICSVEIGLIIILLHQDIEIMQNTENGLFISEMVGFENL